MTKMMMFKAMVLSVLSFFGAATFAHAESKAWDGLWFECEFASRQAPPADDCKMLDDDGFLFLQTV